MTNSIFAVDPGKSTGIAEIRWRPDSAPFIIMAENVDYGPTDMFDAVTEWAQQTKAMPGRIVVYETWTPLGSGADPNYSCQLIGALRVAADKAGIATLGQPSGDRYGVKNDVLKASPYWVSGSRDDHRQAIRHALTYLMNTVGHQPTKLALHPRPTR